jgi:tripartite-type tricarboxylate transporter receptor subunit TctC
MAMNRSRRLFFRLAAAAAALPTLSRIASAQAYPSRTVRIIVGFPPGQAIDIVGRLIADWFQQRLGQPFVVENRPGAAANIATEMVARSPADGYTLLIVSSNNVINTTLYGTVDFAREIAPVATFGRGYQVLNVANSLPVKTVAELIALAKAEPGKLNMASATGANDFVVAGFLKQANVDIARVPYRDTVQAINDLAEGRIQLYVAAYAIMRPQVQAGKVKVIALMNNERAPMLPDVPTAREAGTPALSMDGLVGLFGSKEMPKQVRDQIAADVIAAAGDRELSTKIAATGQIVRPGGADEFAKEIDSQTKVVSDAAAAAGIKRLLQN